MRRRHLPPFEVEIERLAPRGEGEGLAPDGRPVRLRGAPPGARLRVRPSGRRRGVWSARRDALIRPAADADEPRCPVFGRCGGCMLQELRLDAQRRHKQAMALSAVVAEGGEDVLDGVRVHPVRGDEAAYGYRNKLELSFGNRRYLSEEAHAAGEPIEGRFLGFHAPGRWDRIVDTPSCALGSEAMARLTEVVRAHALAPTAPPPRDPREHQGFWRQLTLREGQQTGELAVGLTTTSASEPGWEAAVEALANALMATPLEGARVVGVTWWVDDGVSDAARGALHRTWGQPTLDERLAGRTFRLSLPSFFQTSTRGAEVLVETLREALDGGGERLLDLYCGTGTLGIALADAYGSLEGLEEIPEAVEDARANAARNGIANATFQAVKVEDALEALDPSASTDVVVDPPRAGLHPKVAARLARAPARRLAYVACNPASLGRDAKALREGGFVLTDVWTVDLFPQTGHVELIGRFVRPGEPA